MEEMMAATSLGKQTLVIGAAVGGLAAAGAVSDYFEEIVILRRDELPGSAIPRAGTPEAQHTHALLGGGERDRVYVSGLLLQR
jgi:adenine/guanine phosphoribosyltransferase-like PRPP-binding protein